MKERPDVDSKKWSSPATKGDIAMMALRVRQYAISIMGLANALKSQEPGMYSERFDKVVEADEKMLDFLDELVGETNQ